MSDALELFPRRGVVAFTALHASLLTLTCAVACTPSVEVVTTEAAPRFTFEEEACAQLAGRADTDDEAKAEGILAVGFAVERGAGRIDFTTFGRDDVELGAGSVTISVPVVANDPYVFQVDYVDDEGTASEITRSTVGNGILHNVTTHRAGDDVSYLWWTSGPDGLVIDAYAGIPTDAPVDGIDTFALPEGVLSVIQVAAAGERVRTPEATDALVSQFGFDALVDQQTFRRMHAAAADPNWYGQLIGQALACNASTSNAAFAGSVSCEQKNPFETLFPIACNLANVAPGFELATIAIAATGGAIGASGGLAIIGATVLGAFIFSAVVAVIVKDQQGNITRGVGQLGILAGATDQAGVDAAAEFFSPAAGTAGDPHLTSFDGLAFDLQSGGEVILTRAVAGDFEVQTRQEPIGSSQCGSVSMNTAVVIRLGDDVVSYDTAKALPLEVNGQPLTPLPLPTELAGGAAMVQREDGSLIFAAASGEFVYLRARPSSLDVYVSPAPERRGGYTGILGDFDGSVENDLVGVNGVLDSPPAFAAVHGEFVDRWRVTSETSLFTYAPGEDPSTFVVVGFPEQPASITTLPEATRLAAEEACADIENPIAYTDCVFDVACTGDETFVDSHTFREPKIDAGVVTPVSFLDWAPRGEETAGTWTVAEDGLSVVQELNGNPTFFLSSQTYENVRLNGTIRAGAAGDDDLVGFAFGVQDVDDDPLSTVFRGYVLCWKATVQGGAPEGLRLLYVDGDYGEQIDPVFWDVTSDDVTLVAEDVGTDTGWDYRDHRLSLLYTAEKIEVWIDNEKRLEVDAGSLPVAPSAGRFGFFNYSQAETVYRDFSVGLPTAFPVPERCTFVIDTPVSRFIDQNEIWGDACLNYVVDVDVVVSNAASLTILPGTHVEVADTRSIRAAFDDAALIIRGTADKPITFEGTVAAPGGWAGLVFESPNVENALEHVVINHAGRTLAAPAVYIDAGGFATIDHVAISQSFGDAIQVEAGGTLGRLANSTFREIGGYPVSLPFRNLDVIESTNVFANAGAFPAVELISNSFDDTGVIDRSVTVAALDVPYAVTGSEVFVTGADVFLTLTAGVTLTFPPARSLSVLDGAALHCEGTPGAPVRLAAAEANAFGALYFGSTAPSVLTSTLVEHAGGPTLFDARAAAIYVGGDGDLTLRNSSVFDTEGYAVLVQANGTFVDEGNTYTNNRDGDVLRD